MLQFWCIECEEYVHVHKDMDGRSYFHTKFINSSAFDPVDVDTCEGPFAFSEPPQLTEEDWDLIFKNEPSEEEIQQMDAEAEL